MKVDDPRVRCDTCYHWKGSWIITVFGLKGKMGFCPVQNGNTWKSFGCAFHELKSKVKHEEFIAGLRK